VGRRGVLAWRDLLLDHGAQRHGPGQGGLNGLMLDQRAAILPNITR
jgi:hypothetical protein